MADAALSAAANAPTFRRWLNDCTTTDTRGFSAASYTSGCRHPHSNCALIDAAVGERRPPPTGGCSARVEQNRRVAASMGGSAGRPPAAATVVPTPPPPPPPPPPPVTARYDAVSSSDA